MPKSQPQAERTSEMYDEIVRFYPHAEYEELKKQVDTLAGEKKQLEIQCQQLNEEKKALSTELKSSIDTALRAQTENRQIKVEIQQKITEINRLIKQLDRANNEKTQLQEQYKHYFMFSPKEGCEWKNELLEKYAEYCIFDWEFETLYKTVNSILAKPCDNGNKYGTHALLTKLANIYQLIGNDFFQRKLFNNGEKELLKDNPDFAKLLSPEARHEFKREMLTHCGISIRVVVGLQSDHFTSLRQRIGIFNQPSSPRSGISNQSRLRQQSYEEINVENFFKALDTMTNSEKLSELAAFSEQSKDFRQRNQELIKNHARIRYNEKNVVGLRLNMVGFPRGMCQL